MSTASHPGGLFSITTNGSGTCALIANPPPADWYMDGIRLKTTSGQWLRAVPRNVTIPGVGPLTLLTLST